MDILVADVIGDVALVLIFSGILGAAARRCGQPAVIGQILAGVLLGPSLLGRLPGHLTSRLFPAAALAPLTSLADVAVVIFMFCVGYELDLRALRGRRRTPILVAASALLVPMGLGSALVLFARPQFAAIGQHRFSGSFVLFVAVAVSITALPVLAAIVRERGLAGTTASSAATSAAGLMDVSAWLVLAAALVGTADQPDRPWPVTLLLLCGFTVIMLFAVRPALRWWISRPRSGQFSQGLSGQLPVALMLALASAWVTAALGLHPIFGAFLAGVTMPRQDGIPDAGIVRPLQEISGILLPLFFVVTGLSLNVGALRDAAFLILALVCAVSSLGKMGPAYLASRAGGLERSDAATVAVLVNTRGLTELIALNVGLSSGLIGQQLFTVLVLMALIMTIVTVPLLNMIGVPAPQQATTSATLWRAPIAVHREASDHDQAHR